FLASAADDAAETGKSFRDIGQELSRISREEDYLSAAYRALRHTAEENRLVCAARKAAAVPPSLQKEFWEEQYFPPQALHEYPRIVADLSEIIILHAKGKAAIAEEKAKALHDSDLRDALLLAFSGTDPETLQEILTVQEQSMISFTERYNEMCIKIVLGLQAGYPAGLMERFRKDYGRIGAYGFSADELTHAYLSLSGKSRSEGLLSLEDDIYSEAKEGEKTLVMQGIMKKAMMMIVDGTDPELVHSFIKDDVKHELAETEILLNMTASGALSVQRGENLFITEERLKAHRAGMPDFSALTGRAESLCAESRKNGLTALENDIKNSGSGFFSFLLKLAINRVSPDIITETGYEISKRICEEIKTHSLFRMNAAAMISESSWSGSGGAELENALTFMIPFYGTELIHDFAARRNQWEIQLSKMRYG
ncbi:MAG: hypothetical protein ACRCUT_00870, partial [Spirochaetota bacterium]